MLRRLWVAFVRLITGQGERERLEVLLALLRRNGVTSYEARGLKLQLEPLPKSHGPAETMPAANVPSDDELLFGVSRAQLQREGLIGG